MSARMPPACFREKALEWRAVAAESRLMDDLTNYRLDEADKRADKAEARFDRIDSTLREVNGTLHELKSELRSMRERLAVTATQDMVWGAMATVVGLGLGLLGVFVAILTYLQAFPHPT